MDHGKLVFFMLYPFLCQLVFSSLLCPKDQSLALLQFKHMFTINPNYCDSSYAKTLSWNKSTDCCSWDGVHCDEMTGQVIELNLSCSGLQGKFHSNSSLFQLSNLKSLDLSLNDFSGSLISPKFGHMPASLQRLSVLESLDLSSNKIGGEIPQQLASLTFLAVLNLSHNHLVGHIPKGKQFDTIENSSYQGNDGLHGFPLSKDCGGADQGTTPVELDQEEEEGDSPMISWQAVLIGYGCGLVIGLSVIYIMLSTQNPACFSRLVEECEHRIITRMKKHKKRY